MKTSKLAKVGAFVLVLAVAATGAFASPNDQPGDKYAYVSITGSLIPQKVKIHPIGTTTASNIRIYDRDEIYRTGRFTTEGVLRLDPSIRVISGRPGGGQ
jgi:hypothetical protein